jgi:uncharacterized membrane protein YfcA
MTLTAKALLGYLVIAVILFAWMFRIDAKPASAVSIAAIVTNHWTGTVYYCTTRPECEQIYP